MPAFFKACQDALYWLYLNCRFLPFQANGFWYDLQQSLPINFLFSLPNHFIAWICDKIGISLLPIDRNKVTARLREVERVCMTTYWLKYFYCTFAWGRKPSQDYILLINKAFETFFTFIFQLLSSLKMLQIKGFRFIRLMKWSYISVKYFYILFKNCNILRKFFYVLPINRAFQLIFCFTYPVSLLLEYAIKRGFNSYKLIEILLHTILIFLRTG